MINPRISADWSTNKPFGVVGIGALNGMCVCVDCLDLVHAVIISFGQEVRRQLAPLPQC